MTIVADVETRCARTATRSPNRKRALEYLAAWGAVPITVIERDGACSIHAGKISGTVAARWWIDERMAAQVAREARSLAGRDPDASTATAALARSAAFLKATLTPDDVALGRAADAAKRLDAMIETMRRNGTLREFNAAYKIRRSAAAQGQGFMAFGVAMARFRRALVPHLIGQSAAPMRSIFDQVFR